MPFVIGPVTKLTGDQNNEINMHLLPLAAHRSGLRKFAACLAFLCLAQFVSAQAWIAGLLNQGNERCISILEKC